MFIVIIIILIIYWIYNMQYHKIKPALANFDTVHFRTGDLILFKANNNYNSIVHGSYFGHIGIVCVLNGVPMLFEANENFIWPYTEKCSGIYFTDLKTRIEHYSGVAYLKPLNKDINVNVISGFYDFIVYALQHMYYEQAVIVNGIKKYLDFKKLDKKTDCGQITYLSLIKLGLLHQDKYYVPMLHHLKYMCDLVELDNGYYYMDLLEIKI